MARFAWVLALPRALLQWGVLALLNVVTFLLGLLVVAVAIPFRVPGKSLSDGRPISNLPRWAWLFGNDYDGLLGDKRGWWAANTPWGVAVDSWLAMWWWAAIRNPVNNMRLVPGLYCPAWLCTFVGWGDAYVRDKPGQGGMQFVIARKGWRRWYGFYWVHQFQRWPSRAFIIRLGYKINLGNAGDAELIGQTIKINLAKSIA